MLNTCFDNFQYWVLAGRGVHQRIKFYVSHITDLGLSLSTIEGVHCTKTWVYTRFARGR